MSYRYAATVLAVLGLAMVLSACSSGESEHSNAVEGIVTEVTGDLSNVESFVVLDADGKSHLFKPEAGLLFYGAPLSHLRDHVVTGQPVVVTFKEGPSGERTAILIEHADEHSGHETAG